MHGGNPADYIPILAEANRDWFAASICTVDGQQWSVGDLDIPFSIQSCTKPIMYAVAVEDRGLSYVHRNGPGFEPSGLSFNEVSLNPKGQPHNPYINSGAWRCRLLMLAAYNLQQCCPCSPATLSCTRCLLILSPCLLHHMLLSLQLQVPSQRVP